MHDQLHVDGSSTVDRAVDELRRALFAGELAPGTPLREVPLSESMGVARSTIREALGVLVAEGMAVRVTHKGVAVRRLTSDDIHDVIRARLALESEGVRSWPAASLGARAGLRRALAHYVEIANTTQDPAAVTEAHLQLHRGLVGLTSSERLLAAFDAISAEIRLGLAHLDRIRANLSEQVIEHTHLVELVEQASTEVALEELRRHLVAAEESLRTATGHGTITV